MGQGHLQQEGCSSQAKKMYQKINHHCQSKHAYSTMHVSHKLQMHQAAQSPLLFFNL